MDMDVAIAPTNTSMWRNRENRCYCRNHRSSPPPHLLLLTETILLKKNRRIEKPREVLPAGTKDADFFSRVYDVVRLIPPGRVTSYGAIARFLGSGRSARMVGWAMNACHNVHPPVPAHRVVNRNGQLSGKMHFGHPDQMERLLKKEKIKVSDDTIVNFQQVFWDPMQAIESL